MRALPAGDWKLVIAGTALSVLAYPPFHLLLPSFVVLIPAVRLVQLATADERPVARWLAQGFWYGALTTATVMYGGIPALWRYSPPAVAGFLAVPLIWGLYHALLFWFVGWCTVRFRLSLAAAFPVAWTALEWVVAHQPGVAFPWLGLGTSLTGYPLLVQVADVVGARGVTYLLALANAVLALALFDTRRKGLLVTAVVAGVATCAAYGWYRIATTELIPGAGIALIQPAATITDKAVPALHDGIVERTIELTENLGAAPGVDLVIWPETAVPDSPDDHPDWVGAIERVGLTVGAPVLAGVLLRTGDSSGGLRSRNAAVLYTGRGTRRQTYFKRFLVPLVERAPILARIAQDEPGGFAAGDEATVFDPGAGGFGVLICYESAFEQAARGYRRGGATFLVNITNDAWLEGTTGMSQHPAHLVMRAIENRLGVARAANTGLSLFVDPLGRIHDRVAPGIAAVGIGVVMGTTGGMPLYSRWGDVLGPLCVALVLATLPASRIFPKGGVHQGA